MKILKKLLPLTFVAIASTAEADFLEAIQMSSKARSQIEFIDTESAQGRALAATYKIKENGLFASAFGGNKSAGLELGPYWKKGNLYAMATGKLEKPVEDMPGVKSNFRVTWLYGPKSLVSADGGVFYNVRINGSNTLSTRATAGVKLPLPEEWGSLRIGVEDTFTSGKDMRPYFIARYDRGKWSVVGQYRKSQGIVKVRRDFYR